jgi:hypothetical protein
MEAATREKAAVAAPAPAPPPAASGPRRHAGTLLAVAGLLAVLAISYGWYVAHAGLYSDDWGLIAELKQPPQGGWWEGFQHLWDRAEYRPVSVLYYAGPFWLLGTNGTLQVIWSVLISGAFAAALFGVLRAVGVHAVHAFIVAALVLATSWGDATVLWPAAAPIRFAGAFYLLGLLLSVQALRDPARYGGRWRHVAALACYVIATWTYELTAALTAAGLLVYLLVAPPRRALLRWGIDIAVTVPVMLWTRAHTPKRVGALEEAWSHAKIIVRQLWRIYGDVALPVGSPAVAGVLTLAVGVLGVGLVLRGGRAFPEARRWSIVGFVALVYVMAAYVVFAPADLYYSPGAVNFGNRVNGVGIAPLVLLAYAAVMVVAALATRRVPRALLVVGALYGVIMFINHDRDLKAHQRLYVQASQTELATLDVLQQTVPNPPKGTLLLTTGAPALIAPDLPVFVSTWDLQGAVRLRYDDPSLDGFNAYMGFQCTPGAPTVPAGPPARYGSTILVHVPTRQTWTLGSAAQCRTAAAALGVPQP